MARQDDRKVMDAVREMVADAAWGVTGESRIFTVLNYQTQTNVTGLYEERGPAALRDELKKLSVIYSHNSGVGM